MPICPCTRTNPKNKKHRIFEASENDPRTLSEVVFNRNQGIIFASFIISNIFTWWIEYVQLEVILKVACWQPATNVKPSQSAKNAPLSCENCYLWKKKAKKFCASRQFFNNSINFCSINQFLCYLHQFLLKFANILFCFDAYCSVLM